MEREEIEEVIEGLALYPSHVQSVRGHIKERFIYIFILFWGLASNLLRMQEKKRQDLGLSLIS